MTQSLARFSARRPIVTIGAWIVLVVIALAIIGQLLASATTTELKLSGGFESAKAVAALERLRGGPEPISEVIVIQSETLTVDEPAFAAKVNSVLQEIVELGDEIVGDGAVNYYMLSALAPETAENLVSADRQTTLMTIPIAGDFDEAAVNVKEVIEVVERADEADDFRVLISGPASVSYETNEFARHDLEQGERVGVPVALLILLALFGAVVAALIPIGLAIVAIVIALGFVAIIGQVFDLVFFVTLMITMIGLAVGIDYSLFIISRFREEMDRGLSIQEAVARAGETAGRTVLFSGLTVVIALCGMFIIPMGFFQSLGLGAILVVIIEMAATLTLLPAILALLGPKVDLLSIPFFRRKGGEESHEHREHGFWERTTVIVTKVPWLSFLIVAAPMVVAIVYYFQIETGLNGVETLPDGSVTKEAFFVLEEEFAFGLASPSDIVIEGNIGDPQVQGAIQKLTQLLIEDPRFPIPPLLDPSSSGEIALIKLALPGHPTGEDAVALMSVLRDEHIPAAFSGVPVEVNVGGQSAASAEIFQVVDQYTPIVFTFVLGFSFIVLLLVFRSIVIPIKAVIMNLLSVGTAYGLLVLVFQKGFATDLLGFQRADVIDAWIPLFLFTILFGLSMDYHVFLLSRVRERFDQTGNNTEAVSYGLRSTANLITGAALIMVAVFGAFAAGKTIINQQVGFGLAVAILLDATLVRSVLVPASMEMLGKGNWYLPSWLQWLPDLRVEAEE
ncbi:MAG: MMPL family transporter [Chloroflexi bacterium]|nr:MMPL family transporter [Chloroflexota bacterium]MYK62004.1 MMPL family transporter [Chloroflexota bacterium]